MTNLHDLLAERTRARKSTNPVQPYHVSVWRGLPSVSGVLSLSLALLSPTALPAQHPSRDLVHTLQRILRNGCGESVRLDSSLGPETRGAYARCAERFGIARSGNYQAFVDEVWNRKLALVLLHQFGHLQGRYDLSDRRVIADALREVSQELEIDPPLDLSRNDLDRLYRRYMQSPPAGSLAAAVRGKNLPFTGLELYLQGFKREGELHVFARRAGGNDPFVPLKVFAITYSPFTYPPNGYPHGAGPKTVQGDSKVPEGCYRLTWQNTWSDFYLGYLLSYPNDGDRIRRDRWGAGTRSGGAIVLHGSQVSIGCIPVGNPGIEEIFLLLNKNWRRQQGYATIHIFPCLFDVPENEQILRYYRAARPELTDFWASLRSVYRRFAATRRVPEVGFDQETGYYTLQEPAATRDRP